MEKQQVPQRTRIISTLLWYLIFAAIIYFVNIKYLNYVILFLGMIMLTSSLISKEQHKIVVILKIILTILLFVVYFFRP